MYVSFQELTEELEISRHRRVHPPPPPPWEEDTAMMAALGAASDCHLLEKEKAQRTHTQLGAALARGNLSNVVCYTDRCLQRQHVQCVILRLVVPSDHGLLTREETGLPWSRRW